MPLYEYVCRSCGAEVERLQKFSDPPLTDCPDCGRADLSKKISAAGFRLKGGGWYETDFKKDKRRNLAGGSGASGDGAGAGAETKSSESKDKGKSGSGSESTAKADSGKKSSGSKQAAGS